MVAEAVIAFVMAIGGALTFRRVVDERAAAIRSTMARVAAGDLSQRIPVAGRDDEFTLLNRDINSMLDRLEHAFAEQPAGLGLHRVSLDVLSINPRARALYASLGFVEEGRLRESHRDGAYWCDTILMALLEDDERPARGTLAAT